MSNKNQSNSTLNKVVTGAEKASNGASAVGAVAAIVITVAKLFMKK